MTATPQELRQLKGYKATMRDRLVAIVCNWLLTHVASDHYGVLVYDATLRGLEEMLREQAAVPAFTEPDDDDVLAAARMLRWCGWDVPYDRHDRMDLAVEPSPNLINAARSALKAARDGVPSNAYVTEGPR